MTETTKKEMVKKATTKTTATKTVAKKCASKTITKKSASTTKATAKKAVKKPAKAPERTTNATAEQVKALLAFIQDKLDEGKAENIVAIDVMGVTSFTDYIVIATGTSSRHIFGLSNNLATDLKKAGYHVQVSGDTGDGSWIVIDALDVVVHLFTQETRTVYKLEEFWNEQKGIA